MVISSKVLIMSKKVDYTGLKTNAFTVIKRDQGSKWIVKCNKCGKLYSKTIGEVKKYQSNGCMDCTYRIASSKPNDWHLYIHYKGHAKDKNRVFDLTYEQFKTLSHSNCYYCGAEPTVVPQLQKYCKNSESQKLNGIDRVDSSKGYTLDNCVPCCSICNQIKSNINQQLFLQQIEKIHNYRNVQRLSCEGVGSSDSKKSGSERSMI